MNGKEWTPTEVKLFKKLYPHKTTEFLEKKFKRSDKSMYSQAFLMGLKKSKKYLATQNSGRFWRGSKHIGKESQFPKGHTPWNKGTKGLQIGGKETQFKKGNKPMNYRKVGSKRINVDGYVEVKVKDPNKWDLLHRIKWVKHRGKIPKGVNIQFKDGNKKNCKLSNLIMVSKKQNMVMNSIQRYPKELRSTMMAVGKLRRTINKKQKDVQA